MPVMVPVVVVSSVAVWAVTGIAAIRLTSAVVIEARAETLGVGDFVRIANWVSQQQTA